jgi:hypothetical protein
VTSPVDSVQREAFNPPCLHHMPKLRALDFPLVIF